jgi:hypothetical protein
MPFAREAEKVVRSKEELDGAMELAEVAMEAEGLALGPRDTLAVAQDEDSVLRAYITFAEGGTHVLQLGQICRSPSTT